MMDEAWRGGKKVPTERQKVVVVVVSVVLVVVVRRRRKGRAANEDARRTNQRRGSRTRMVISVGDLDASDDGVKRVQGGRRKGEKESVCGT